MIDGAGDFVGGGDQRLHRAELDFLAAIERAEGTWLRMTQAAAWRKAWPARLSVFKRVIAQNLAAGDFVVRGQAKPGAEVFLGGEAAHIGADFGEDRLRQRGAEAFDGDQIDARNAEEFGPGVVRGLVLAAGARLGFGERWQFDRNLPAGFDRGKLAFEFGVAVGQLVGEEDQRFRAIA